MRPIVRSGANDLIESLQFCAHPKLHKERLDELIGLINSKRCQPDEFTCPRRCPECILRSTSAICSNMNRHMRLENGRAVSAGQIVNDLLKTTVFWLGR